MSSDVENILKALSLIVSLSGELNRLIQQASAEGRDITDEELKGLRAESQAALDEWLEMDE